MSGKEMCTAEIKLISCGGEAAEGAAAEEFAAEEIAVRGRMREEEDCVTFFFRTDEAAFCLTFGRGVRIVRTGSVAYTLQLEPGGTCAACIRTPYGEIAAEARVAEQFLERTPERLDYRCSYELGFGGGEGPRREIIFAARFGKDGGAERNRGASGSRGGRKGGRA